MTMPEPPPISVVAMMRRRLPEGYVLVLADDLETLLNQKILHRHLRPGVWDGDNGERAGLPCTECAVRERLWTALRGELTAEEQAAWDVYAAERQATAKPDSREALQALIDASIERIIRKKIVESLRRTAAGRREYAANAPDHIREELEHEALGYEASAYIVEDPRHVMGAVPSWRWTDEETASICPERGGR